MGSRTIIGKEPVARQKPPANTNDHGARLKALEDKVEELILQAEAMFEDVTRSVIQSNRAVSKVNQLNGKYRRVHR